MTKLFLTLSEYSLNNVFTKERKPETSFHDIVISRPTLGPKVALSRPKSPKVARNCLKSHKVTLTRIKSP